MIKMPAESGCHSDADFHYYGMLQHQQNMLQDYVRTATYYTAIMENKADFAGKVVMDVGAGTGILSLFAAQVGTPLHLSTTSNLVTEPHVDIWQTLLPAPSNVALRLQQIEVLPA